MLIAPEHYSPRGEEEKHRSARMMDANVVVF